MPTLREIKVLRKFSLHGQYARGLSFTYPLRDLPAASAGVRASDPSSNFSRRRRIG